MKKADVLEFTQRAEENIFRLITNLRNGSYAHSKYIRFSVCDPKRREIAKASVSDRVLHHAICRVLTPIFESSFIFDSYSSREGKGIHKAVHRLHMFAQKVSRNNTKSVWVLQMDIRKFFDSVDHGILLELLKRKIKDKKIIELLEVIVYSYEKSFGKGIPLGNLTSQLFSNVYLDALDQFMKRSLGVKWYVRYADDIVVLSHDKNFLESCLIEVASFIDAKLKIEMHPRKITLKKWHEGIDFLGYVDFPSHRVLRTKTKRRMLKNIKQSQNNLNAGLIDGKSFNAALQSYFGVLSHCKNTEIKRVIGNIINVV